MKNLLVVLFSSLLFATQAQTPKLLLGKALHFQIQHQKDSIDFLVIDSVLTQKKPVMLFCQGSLPMPLIVNFKEYGPYLFAGGVSNFNVPEIVKHYHLVVISMPHTPVSADQSQLNSSLAYITDPAQPYSFTPEYVKADYLQNYVRRAQAVLKFLKKQPWVDRSKLVVAGHSQGSKVASKVALENKRVTHLGLFGANPFGRIDQFVRQARLDAQAGKITWAQADSIMEEKYRLLTAAHQPETLKEHPDLMAWKTFSEPLFDDWLRIKCPIYLAYGTDDRVADLCDLIPLFFIQEGKNNLTYKRYLGMDHNFFEVDEHGVPNYDKGHWKEVMQQFINWSLTSN
ncbi:MAG: alpha/beta hydrolase [Saprospiraceae bacterium]|nr:alpha/beta hydrolase [Saprospiraceae bacterium]